MEEQGVEVEQPISNSQPTVSEKRGGIFGFLKRGGKQSPATPDTRQQVSNPESLIPDSPVGEANSNKTPEVV